MARGSAPGDVRRPWQTRSSAHTRWSNSLASADIEGRLSFGARYAPSPAWRELGKPLNEPGGIGHAQKERVAVACRDVHGPRRVGDVEKRALAIPQTEPSRPVARDGGP